MQSIFSSDTKIEINEIFVKTSAYEQEDKYLKNSMRNMEVNGYKISLISTLRQAFTCTGRLEKYFLNQVFDEMTNIPDDLIKFLQEYLGKYEDIIT